jgi:lambda family phage portal protein
VSAVTRFLGRIFGGSKPPDQPAPQPKPTPQPAHHPRPGARYDAASTTDENQKHWANADYFSANVSALPAIRRLLRARSRYERANNGYAKGLIRGRTNDTIGTGPRLQLDFPDEVFDKDFQRPVATGTPTTTPADLAHEVERLWCEWCEYVGFNDKLRTLADAEDTDGEGFALFANAGDDAFPITLRVRVIEADRVMTPDLVFPTPLQIDGIRFNEAGEPIAYDVLRRHPGDVQMFTVVLWEYDTIPARQVVHQFDADRPEQSRGIPILTPALPLYSILRRYTLASLGAAEVGAMIAGVIENPNLPPDSSGDDPPEFEAMDAIPFARNALLTLAGGQTAKAFDSKQPAPEYAAFKSEVLTECGRAAGDMRNTATGSSAEYNYSSGRLDHLPRQRGIVIRRERIERQTVDKAFRMWAEEALMIPGYLPEGLPPYEEWEWCWHWDGFESIDAFKDANAQKIRKEIGLTTDADELAKEGKDWREHYRQLAREKAMRTDLGIEPVPPPVAPPAPVTVNPDTGNPVDPTEPAGPNNRLPLTVYIGQPAVTVAAPVITVNMPEMVTPAPVVNVQPAEVHVSAPAVTVAPAQVTMPAPVVNLTVPEQPTPVVNVTVPEQVAAPVVTVEVPQPKKTTRTVTRDADKLVKETVETHEY